MCRLDFGSVFLCYSFIGKLVVAKRFEVGLKFSAFILNAVLASVI